MFFSSIFFQPRERAKREKFPNIGMSEVIKDSAIKLFGRTISLPRNNNNEVSAHDSSSELPVPPEDSSDQNPPSSSSSPREEVSSTKEHEQAKREKESPRKELTSTQDDEASHQTTEDLKSPTSSSISENPKTPSNEREKPSKDGEQSDTTSVSKSQDKTPKKPDKILPCPRCNSMDTKFCYYNNYNVNQPRHFCKNCQRYWTAGGTMRNVPVGAGRRKNKNSSSSAAHFRQMLLPESLQTPKFNSANGLHLQSGVLAFGSDSPLCDSIASTLSLGEKSPKNGFHTPKLNGFVSCGREDDNNISVGGSSLKASTSSNEESLDKNFQAQSFSSPNWPYPYTWNPSLYQASSYPMPFYPTQAFWGCMPISPPPPPPSWNLNSISPQSCVSYQNAPNSNPNSPTLGKHSRDGQKDAENTSVLIPKTLRIDDPSEAAKSSIWSTLGIKNEKKGSSLFKAFGSKGDEDEKNHVVLQANPAALSRSLTFHERT